MFEAIGMPEHAEAWILNRLAAKHKIPGFGHRVYKCEDPRAGILRDYARIITEKVGDTRFYEIAQAVEKTMLANSKVFPNVDFYSGILYRAMGIPTELFTPIFAMSRAVGWSAHILEQWRKNRLIRPSAHYIGPALRPYTAIEDRSS